MYCSVSQHITARVCRVQERGTLVGRQASNRVANYICRSYPFPADDTRASHSSRLVGRAHQPTSPPRGGWAVALLLSRERERACRRPPPVTAETRRTRGAESLWRASSRRGGQAKKKRVGSFFFPGRLEPNDSSPAPSSQQETIPTSFLLLLPRHPLFVVVVPVGLGHGVLLERDAPA
jgi:hypothetical protein